MAINHNHHKIRRTQLLASPIVAFTLFVNAVEATCLTMNPFDVEIVEPTNATVDFIDPSIADLPLNLDLKQNITESDTRLIVIEEQEDFALPSSIEVNLRADTRKRGFISKGTVVDDYLVHFDPYYLDRRLHVRLTFARPVLGLITKNGLLKATDDIFGREDIKLKPQKARGIDGNDSTVMLSQDARMLSLNLLVTDFYDQMRILVSPFDPSLLPGDYNNDGSVDAVDFTVWQDNFGTNGRDPCTLGDGDGDGDTDGADFFVWQQHFGISPTDLDIIDANGSFSVPEPTSGLLLMLGLAGVLTGRGLSVSKLSARDTRQNTTLFGPPTTNQTVQDLLLGAADGRLSRKR